MRSHQLPRALLNLMRFRQLSCAILNSHVLLKLSSALRNLMRSRQLSCAVFNFRVLFIKSFIISSTLARSRKSWYNIISNLVHQITMVNSLIDSRVVSPTLVCCSQLCCVVINSRVLLLTTVCSHRFLCAFISSLKFS